MMVLGPEDDFLIVGQLEVGDILVTYGKELWYLVFRLDAAPENRTNVHAWSMTKHVKFEFDWWNDTPLTRVNIIRQGKVVQNVKEILEAQRATMVYKSNF